MSTDQHGSGATGIRKERVRVAARRVGRGAYGPEASWRLAHAVLRHIAGLCLEPGCAASPIGDGRWCAAHAAEQRRREQARKFPRIVAAQRARHKVVNGQTSHG